MVAMIETPVKGNRRIESNGLVGAMDLLLGLLPSYKINSFDAISTYM